MKSEMKMPRDRDREVKCPKISREFSRNETLAGYCRTAYPAKVYDDYGNDDNTRKVFVNRKVLLDRTLHICSDGENLDRVTEKCHPRKNHLEIV